MFTSRAEHRLLLRQDNADLRLRHYGYEAGLVDEARYRKVGEKKRIMEEESVRLSRVFKQIDGKGLSLAQLICRPEKTYAGLMQEYPENLTDFGNDINFQIELNLKYAGYINRQTTEVAKLEHVENIAIPSHVDYSLVHGLRNEARQKLSHVGPKNLGQALRISGVSPADISILMIALTKQRSLC